MLKLVMMNNSAQFFLNEPFCIGSLQLANRLIQGPLAGFSCAPFRALYYQFTAPAYCVSEMISAYDVLHKHQANSRYLYRAPAEKKLCYQISGRDPFIMAEAARRLEAIGADLIDLNCGCPKTKIRKKGAGSALLENPQQLSAIVSAVRQAITVPLTVKLRIQGNESDFVLAKMLEAAGADALIVHGRHWTDDYDKPPNLQQIAGIKKAVKIPVIANGDFGDQDSLNEAVRITACDAYMIARAGSGKPWIYQELLEAAPEISPAEHLHLFMTHLVGLSHLESEHQAVLQSRRLVRYYFRQQLNQSQLTHFYSLPTLKAIKSWMTACLMAP